MATVTERLPVLVSKKFKNEIARRAKAANVSMGEFVRRAAEAYRPEDDEKLLEAFLEQVTRSTEQASLAMDAALAFSAESQRRIEAMEANHPVPGQQSNGAK